MTEANSYRYPNFGLGFWPLAKLTDNRFSAASIRTTCAGHSKRILRSVDRVCREATSAGRDWILHVTRLREWFFPNRGRGKMPPTNPAPGPSRTLRKGDRVAVVVRGIAVVKQADGKQVRVVLGDRLVDPTIPRGGLFGGAAFDCTAGIESAEVEEYAKP